MRLALLAACAALAACAHTPADDPSDPLEPVNRGLFAFNETADKYVLRPVAKGYDKVMPDLAKEGVHNVLSNLFYPTVFVNDFLQGKFGQGVSDTGRFLINSTFGIAGVFDVATKGGMPENDEDFGQTLGYWGLGPGWYIMLPFYGPSDNRDLVGRVTDGFTNPANYASDRWLPYEVTVVEAVDKRVRLLPADRFLQQQLDRYVFVRTIYLQNRNAKVYDGNPPHEDLEFNEDEADKPAQ